MIATMIIWGITAWLFCARLDCSVDTVIIGFYIMVGFGLIIFDKKLQRGKVQQALNNVLKTLKKNEALKSFLEDKDGQDEN